MHPGTARYDREPARPERRSGQWDCSTVLSSASSAPSTVPSRAPSSPRSSRSRSPGDPPRHGRPGRGARPGPHDRAQPLHHRAAPTPTTSALRLRRGARGGAHRRRAGARRVPALPAGRPAAGELHQRERPRDRRLPAPHLHRASPGRAPKRREGDGDVPPRPGASGAVAAAAAPPPGPARPAPRPADDGGEPTQRQAPASPPPGAAGQPGRPALAGRRRRALPAAWAR